MPLWRTSIALNVPPTVAHLTVVHRRFDTRIYAKEVRTLAAAGYSVALIVADGQGDDQIDGVPIYDLGSLAGSRWLRFLRGFVRSWAMVRRLRPHILHIHDPELLAVAVVLRMTGVRIVYDAHEDLPRQVAYKTYIPALIRPVVAAIAGLMEWVGVFFSSRVVSATPLIAARFAAEKSVLVRNFPIPGEVTPGRGERGTEVRRLVYVGGLQEVRGIRQMVMAIDRCPPGVELHLAGTFATEELARMVQGLPGWARVIHHGWLDRHSVAALLRTADLGLVLLQPVHNLENAYPVKMFEYMAAGVPFVASDYPAWRSLLAGSDVCAFVDPVDPDAIGAAVLDLLNAPDRLEAMGVEGRRSVEQRFNWGTEATTLLGAYADMIGAPS